MKNFLRSHIISSSVQQLPAAKLATLIVREQKIKIDILELILERCHKNMGDLF
jgi:hypothetical protein